MNKNLSDIQSDKRMHLKSQFMAQQLCAIHHIVDLLYHKKRSLTKKVFYFTPNVSCRWIKLEFINCIKTKIWCVTWISYLQLVCKCKLFCLFVFCSESTSAFYFLTFVLGVCENRKTGLYGFLFSVDTSFICYK